MNPLKELAGQGQSIWLDYIRRNLILSGDLKRLVEEDGIRGVTSNPTIFEKAIAGSTDCSAVLPAAIVSMTMNSSTNSRFKAAGVLNPCSSDSRAAPRRRPPRNAGTSRRARHRDRPRGARVHDDRRRPG